MTFILKLENTLDRWDLLERNAAALSTILIISISLIIRFFCLGSHDLLVEEAYYWNYSQHLDFGYLDHPPMVALLIKASTLIFGTNEFGVRFPALFCWGVAAFFSYKWTELMAKGSGLYALVLLSVLPFYFVQSVVFTPDQPVLVCWSAALYYFYRVFINDEPTGWYKAGVWLGLGLLSKYTIVLFGPAVLIYLLLVPSARFWFIRKEPYLCALIAALLFTPVIYWNATHDWISFVFQSTRRFQDIRFSFHHFMGLFLLYLLPGGVIGLCGLWNNKIVASVNVEIKTRRFIQIFTLFPLAFFGIYSFNHPIKIDWIGPGLISVVPWLALLIAKHPKFFKVWHWGAPFLLLAYTILFIMITFGTSETASRELFRKMISWEQFTEQIHTITKNVSLTKQTTPIIAPMDLYNIGSELEFYQAKLLKQGKIQQSYKIIGRHIFGLDSLMFEFWSPNKGLTNQVLILVTDHMKDIDRLIASNRVIPLAPAEKIWSYSQGRGMPVFPYYYEVVQMK